MTRHIEFTINYDLTCWDEDMEFFRMETEESIKEGIYDYIEDSPDELMAHLIINKIWYEED